MNIIQNNSFKKITVSLMLGMIVLFVITFISSLGNNKITIDKFHNLTIHRKDGTVEYYDSNMFKPSTKGDIVTADFTLPEKPGEGQYSLFSHVYNSVVTISFKDKILFTYGEEPASNGRETGHIFICANIPDDAWGDKITVQIKLADYSNEHSLNTFEIYKTSEKEKYIFNGSPIPYFISVMFVVLSFIILIPLLFLIRKGPNRFQGVFLMIFCLSTTIWGMGYQNMTFITYDNSLIVCDLEYIAIFAIPFSFAIFMYQIGNGKIYKKIMFVISVISSCYFVIATILNYTTDNLHYCRLLKPIQVIIFLGIIILLIHYTRQKNLKTYQEKSIRTGSIVFLIFITFDFIVYFLNSYGYVHISVTLVPFGLFSFLLIILISYLMNIVDLMMTVKEQERLQKMAYTDGMTGISNRRACLEFIEELNNYKDEYAIVFFDVNNLKTANDQYSHEVGDKLICCSAKAISDAFDGKCFCGRYGGDEFIACIKKSGNIQAEIEERLDNFRKNICVLNNQGDFPFEISIAYGYASSCGNSGKKPEEIVSQADREMYVQKTKMKNFV